MNILEYFENIEKQVKREIEVAERAREKGFDPSQKVEVPVATSLAERVTGLVSVLYPQVGKTPEIVARILELEKQFGPLDPAIALTIAEEVAREKFCKFESHLQAIEAGIRIALGYLTLGYVSSPIEGFIRIELKKTAQGEDYFAPYYSGPIRSAGGTEAAFSLVVVDHLREVFGYAKYDPTEDEIKRGIHECYIYHERITNLQYLPSEQELDFLLRNMPVMISGDPSEDKEVYNYKDLKRIETNVIRSGFTLVTGEGLAQKAPKILKRVVKLKEKGFKLSGWDWLAGFCDLQKKIKEGKKGNASREGATYIQDLVGGRPVFAHPSESGAFRLRYGRARNTGYSTLALNPATMGITNEFIAVGTQLKIEIPTKGCTVASVDSIEGPIVKLYDGSVIKVKTYQEAKKLYGQTEEIIYLGDILVPYGDFANRNHVLEPAGYEEFYWIEELRAKGGESELFPDFERARELSKGYEVAMHPKYIFFWREISREQFLGLIDWIGHGTIHEGKIILPYTHGDKERFKVGKRALELIGCEHSLTIENVIIKGEEAKALMFNMGIEIREGIVKDELSLNSQRLGSSNVLDYKLDIEIDRIIGKMGESIKDESKKVLELLNMVSLAEIRDKSGTFIGARMGRPEKAKLRVLVGSPHVLFPVGDEGGRLRSVIAAVEKGNIRADFATYYCDECKEEKVYPRCEQCGKINRKTKNEGVRGGEYEYRQMNLDIKKYFEEARKRVGIRNDEVAKVVKGVRGTSNKEHSVEYLGKGLLRAKYNLNVNKDGTIRYDMTEMPITHFRAVDVGTSVEKLRGMGYEKDIEGKPLENDKQLLEIFPHDIILPACKGSPDEGADDVFLGVSKFVDDELEKIYGNEKFFGIDKKEDLIGMLFGCMAPHTCSTTVGRLIGFSKVQALLCSPYIHAAMRRDCDGDEAAVMLLMDLFINFSRSFIPAHRGGTQDAPLVLNMRIRANEVDDMIFDLDVTKKIPLELYRAASQHKGAGDVKMEQIKNRLAGDREFVDIGFTHDTANINEGPGCSSYKTLPSMQDKVDGMMELCRKIRAVDTSDVARLIIERHFIRDTRGNLRKFSMQAFRCVGCNESYRRVPLAGKCEKCGGRLIFTIAEGSVMKYMKSALDLARDYEVSPYLLESLELTEMYIQSIFGKEKHKQESIKKWFGT